jgi:hypothetical protein
VRAHGGGGAIAVIDAQQRGTDRAAETTHAQDLPDRRVPALLAAALTSIYLLLVIAPLVRGAPPVAGGVVLTVLFTAALLAAAALAGRLRLSWWHELAGMVLGVGLWYVLADLGEKGSTLRLVTLPAADVMFLGACVLAGRLLSRILRERNILLPIAIVLAGADLFTVFLGPTAAFLEHAPELVAQVSVKLPEVGSAAGPEGAAGLAHMATLGPGDTIFAALLFACVARFGLSLRANYRWMALVVAGFLALVIAVPALPPLPVLPAMAVAFLLANRGQFDLSAEERRIMLVAFGFVLVLFVGLYLVTRALLPPAPPEQPPAPVGPADIGAPSP